MSISPLAKKLGIKPGFSLLVLDPADDFIAALNPLPDGASIVPADSVQQVDFVVQFVTTKAEIAARGPAAAARVKPAGLLWFGFPKKTGAIRSDISRDTGWQPMLAAGYEHVMLVAIDDTWSAFRFRSPSGSRTRHLP